MSAKSYWIAGAVSGFVWSLVALLLEFMLEEGRHWAIPRDRLFFLVAIMVSGIATGEFTSLLFRRPIQNAGRGACFILPLLTLPVSITFFAGLVWLIRQTFGVHFEPSLPPAGELRLIVVTYLLVLLTLFGPFLYGLALLNQYALRLILRQKNG
jgi:hypothetical protein